MSQGETTPATVPAAERDAWRNAMTDAVSLCDYDLELAAVVADLLKGASERGSISAHTVAHAARAINGMIADVQKKARDLKAQAELKGGGQ